MEKFSASSTESNVRQYTGWWSNINSFDRRLIVSLIISSSIISIVPLFYQGVGIQIGILLGVIIILIQGARLIRGRVDFIRVEEWAIFGFLIWMPIGYLKYLLLSNTYREVPTNTIDYCAFLTCLGFSFQLIGMLAAPDIVIPKTLKRKPYGPLAIVLSILTLSGVAIYRIKSNNFFGILPENKGLIVALGIMFLPLFSSMNAYYAKVTHGSSRIVYVFLVLFFLLMAFSDSSRRVFGAVLFGVFFVFFPDTGLWRSSLLKVSSLVLCLLLVFYLTATFMRSMSFSAGETGALKEDFIWSAMTARNLSTLEDFALSVEMYPDKVPFLYGKSYLAAVLTFIPRAIWPSKPVSFSKELAIRKIFGPEDYQYTRDLDEAMNYQSYSGTLIGEAWANFGLAGVLIVPMIYGIGLGVIGRWIVISKQGAWLKILSGVVLFTVLIQNRGCSTAVNSFIIIYAFYLLIDQIIYWLLPIKGYAG